MSEPGGHKENQVEAATPSGVGQGRAQRVTKSVLAKDLGSRDRGPQRTTLGGGGGEAKQQEGHGKLLASASSVCSVAHAQLLLVEPGLARPWGNRKPWGPEWRQSSERSEPCPHSSSVDPV